MKYKYFWIVFGLFLGYGLLPVSIPDFITDYKNPNTLLVRSQECGRPYVEGVIVKGHLTFSKEIKERFPELSEHSVEITLISFPPFDINDEEPEELYFANHNTFRVTGETVGIDTIDCNPKNFELAPKFKVESWALTSYYPRYNTFPLLLAIAYPVSAILGLPSLLAFLYLSFRKNERKDG